MAAVYEETHIYEAQSVGSFIALRKLKNFEDMLFINSEKIVLYKSPANLILSIIKLRKKRCCSKPK